MVTFHGQYLTARDTRKLPRGTKVFCNVTQIRTWFTMTDVRPRDGYIKISGERGWCPPSNFQLTDLQGRTWEQVNAL